MWSLGARQCGLAPESFYRQTSVESAFWENCFLRHQDAWCRPCRQSTLKAAFLNRQLVDLLPGCKASFLWWLLFDRQDSTAEPMQARWTANDNDDSAVDSVDVSCVASFAMENPAQMATGSFCFLPCWDTDKCAGTLTSTSRTWIVRFQLQDLEPILWFAACHSFWKQDCCDDHWEPFRFYRQDGRWWRDTRGEKCNLRYLEISWDHVFGDLPSIILRGLGLSQSPASGVCRLARGDQGSEQAPSFLQVVLLASSCIRIIANVHLPAEIWWLYESDYYLVFSVWNFFRLREASFEQKHPLFISSGTADGSELVPVL